MIHVEKKDKKNCSGCTACANICPTKAITMKSDSEGFVYPSIEEKLCIDCCLCDKVCPFHEKYERCQNAYDEPKYIVAIHNNKDIRRTSRSGGAFMAFSEYILKQGGIVYGVALDSDCSAVHIKVSSSDKLKLLQGSKYVQSDKKDVFSKVRSDLLQGNPVLFSGTPCEVSGLLSYLKTSNTNTERLYTCDIICHGTPSPLMWKENIKLISKKLGKLPERVDFRDKKFGWRSHIESYHSGNKKIYSNVFTTLFYKHLFLRPACSNCQYCNRLRSGDITLADAWGVEKVNKALADNRGASLLLINSDKGKELFQECNSDLTWFPIVLDQFRQPNLEHPSTESPIREKFWQDYRQYQYKYVSRKYYDIISKAKLIYNILSRRY